MLLRTQTQEDTVIVDVHVHAGAGPNHWNYDIWREALEPYGTPVEVLEQEPVDIVRKMQEAGVTKACLLALKAPAWRTVIPNEYVAGIVAEHPDLFIGFASVDPNMGLEAADELERAYEDLGMRGVKLAPCYQMYHPLDPVAFPVYDRAQELGMPILFHQAWTRIREAPMKWAHPMLLDDLALAFPELRIILAHVGLPWQVDALHLAAKHPNVYVDISARDAPSYGGGYSALAEELLLARTLMILDKVLYGSDCPWTDPATYVEQIQSINKYAGQLGEPLSSDEVEMILGGNAERMLGELDIL
jgi:predicted TIM-barrel fold metal-dependent hydrolase